MHALLYIKRAIHVRDDRDRLSLRQLRRQICGLHMGFDILEERLPVVDKDG